jgi:hypothetical protein
VSQPYIESLKKVTTIPILSESILSQSQSHGPTEEAKHKEETANDRLLLNFILASEEDGIVNAKTPYLLALAKLDSQIYPIYNNETSMEFHRLLLELLKSFEEAVASLCRLLHPSKHSNRYHSTTQSSTIPTQSAITDAMTDVQVYGYGLLKLARGQAFRMHMENIGHLLKKPDHTNAGVSNEELEDGGPDEELRALEPVLPPNGDKDNTRKTLTKSYIDWLRLTVAHLDAIEIVVQYVMSSKFVHNYISVKNLVAPSTSAALYPWEELLKSGKYLLPKKSTPSTPESQSQSQSETTNDEILKFLQDTVPGAVQATTLQLLSNAALAGWNNRHLPTFKIQQVCQKISDIVQFGDKIDTVVKQLAESVHAQLILWPKGNNNAITQGIDDLHKKFSHPPPGTVFFSSLPKLMFKGALHCEACLASIIYNATESVQSGGKEYAEILKQLKVSSSLIHFSPDTHLFVMENSPMDE